ncbi:MAG: L-seryl-tRNA(Sec) selenium transferase [Acidimicrobiia bacterium]|nr:L-seryl-tRNA(Sec) selenium transferase [Acidimicrobiia bacterium]
MQKRRFPSVDRLAGSLYDGSLPRGLVVQVTRDAIDDARRGQGGVNAEDEAIRILDVLKRRRPLRVINATGVLLHTNLGRAPWHPESARMAMETAVGYGNTELDLAAGDRGGRAGYLHRLLSLITGAEAALVVNNNAGGLLLALMALAAERQVPVSRSELIEIGGAYRLPELMAASGAQLVEVGTTNRTRPEDYRRALRAETALLLKVHPSNYRIVGFSEEATLPELSQIATPAGIPLIFDAGSGLLDERVPWWAGPPPSWLAEEPGVLQSLERGADLVLFSGDKLFGGPQAGIIVGREKLVSRLRRHPAARALRVDGAITSALVATAEAYADGRAGELPFWRMAGLDRTALEERARRVIEAARVQADVEEGGATPGAGSVPGSTIPGPVIAIRGQADQMFSELLRGDPPVVARRERGRLMVDLRTVFSADDEVVARALRAACR